MKIIDANITAMPKTFLDPMPVVSVMFEDGTRKELFSFYPDEISFTPKEFIGLTEAEARELKLIKDRTYLTI